jgi:hypothetical protein
VINLRMSKPDKVIEGNEVLTIQEQIASQITDAIYNKPQDYTAPNRIDLTACYDRLVSITKDKHPYIRNVQDAISILDLHHQDYSENLNEIRGLVKFILAQRNFTQVNRAVEISTLEDNPDLRTYIRNYFRNLDFLPKIDDVNPQPEQLVSVAQQLNVTSYAPDPFDKSVLDSEGQIRSGAITALNFIMLTLDKIEDSANTNEITDLTDTEELNILRSSFSSLFSKLMLTELQHFGVFDTIIRQDKSLFDKITRVTFDEATKRPIKVSLVEPAEFNEIILKHLESLNQKNFPLNIFLDALNVENKVTGCPAISGPFVNALDKLIEGKTAKTETHSASTIEDTTTLPPVSDEDLEKLMRKLGLGK